MELLILFLFSSAFDGFRPIIIADGFDSSQLRQSAYLYFLHAENFASVFKLCSIHDSAYFLEELSKWKELVGVTHRRLKLKNSTEYQGW